MSTPSSGSTQKAQDLAEQAKVLKSKGELQQAARKLREAISIDPQNEQVKQAWEEIKQEERGEVFVSLCQRWIEHLRDADGEEALDYIHHHQISPEVAEEAMGVMLQYSGDSDMADQITGQLLKLHGARQSLAKELEKHPTMTFNKMFDRGDDSMDGITDLLFDKTAWPTETVRIAAERDAFQLALAQTMHAGQDHPERAMKQISRLLGLESSNLKGLIDADGFDVILSQLDIREPDVLRSQATVATAKLLELSPDTSQQLISQFVVKRIEGPTAEGLIQAFSAAASVFPMAPQHAAQLFLSSGFLQAFVYLVNKWKSQKLEQAALELLSIACMDKACRDGIRSHCLWWLTTVSESNQDKKSSGQAGVILVKLQQDAATASNAGEQKQSLPVNNAESQAELVSRFKSMIISNDERTPKQDSIEGLAYASIKAKVKEELAGDQAFLETLVKSLQEMEKQGKQQALFGGLTIISNLTMYLPVLSDEQQKLSQLKDYASSRKPKDPEPLDDDDHVSARCQRVLNAGVVPLLVSASGKKSPAIQILTLQILNALSKEQKHRPKMAQQGAVKRLLVLYDTLSASTTPKPTSSDSAASVDLSAGPKTAAHALARILISVNPGHVFGSSGLSITSAIRPISSLLSPDSNDDGPTVNLLPVFEGLLALTNLASTDDSARDAILRLSWSHVEDLMLSHNEMVRRGAVELLCNLTASPSCVAKYADGSKQASNRLHVLLALADVEDFATRRAAGGALAQLTEWDKAASAVIDRERGVKVLLSLCEEESPELQHRGIVCIYNIVIGPADVGVRGRAAVKKDGGVEVLRNLLLTTKDKEIMQTGIEILKTLA